MPDWDACLAQVQLQPLSGVLLRMVESQEQVATNQLVSGLDRQAVLEEMLDATKPPYRAGCAHLHYLLATPFRYPPLKWGSRFGRRNEPSLFYGSLATATVLCEAAYYRFVFWSGMAQSPIGKLDTQHTLFAAEFRAERAVRLQDPPFDAFRAALTHPADYSASQPLGARLRAAGVQLFEFVSAREPAGGINVALFTPTALARPAPVAQDAWLCETTARRVRFNAVHGRAIHDFPIELFQIEGCLPLPA